MTNRAYSNFLDSINAEKTKQAYVGGLNDFRRFIGAKDFEELLAIQDSKILQEKIIDYVRSLRARKLAYRSIRVLLSAVRHFYVMNDVTVNWPKIYKFIGEKKTTIKDRIYTKEEIQSILEKCDERKKVMFLLLLTGMRIGALPDLKIRNLKKWSDYGIYQITVYENTTSEYITFTTPETAQAIDSYLAFRKRAGEVIKPESPLLREQFDIEDAPNPRPVTLGGLYTVMQKPMIQAGVRQKSDDMHKRKDVMLFHGFRKYVNTMMNQAGVKPVIKEMLLGHKVGLENSYYRPADKEILKEFLKAGDLLTISDEKQLKQQVEKLKIENEQIGVIKQSYLEMKVTIDSKDQELRDVKEQVRTIVEALGSLNQEDRNRVAQRIIQADFKEKRQASRGG